MQEILLKIGYFERGLSKALRKLSLLFLLNPVFFNAGQDYEKKKGLELVTITLQVVKKIPLLVIIT